MTTAKLTLTNRSEAWSYKGNHVSCTNVAAGTNEVNLTGLRSGWDYLIDAYPAHGCPANSSPHYLDSVIFTTLFPKIEGVSVTAGVASLSVGWTAQSETFGQVGYHVQWKSGNQDWSSERQSDVSTNAATISGLTGNVTYTVRVRSHFRNFINRIKYGAWSDPVTGTPGTSATNTVSTATVSAIAALVATNVNETTAKLTITNHTTAWWYKYTTPTGDSCSSNAVTGLMIDPSNLSPNTDYTYKAYSNNNCSTELASESFLTKPGKPSKPQASVGAGSGKLTITATVSGDGTLTGWQYQQSTDGGSFSSWSDISSTSTSLSYTVSGLTDGTNYQFKVRAMNATGTGVASEASDVVRITDLGPTQKAWLSRFGRTVAGQLVDAVTERLDGGSPENGGLQVTLGGQRIEAAANSQTPPGLNGMRPDPWTETQAWHTQTWPQALRAGLQGLEESADQDMKMREFPACQRLSCDFAR